MAKKIRITAEGIQVFAELAETRTARAIWNALPIRAQAKTWGDEIYFSIPVGEGPENPVEIVERGDLGYWPPGKAFCIFFGPTPYSMGEEIRPASAVNPVGKILGDPSVFRRVRDGVGIEIEAAED